MFSTVLAVAVKNHMTLNTMDHKCHSQTGGVGIYHNAHNTTNVWRAEIDGYVQVCTSLVGWVRFNVPPHIIGHTGDGFLQIKWPNQQCQSSEGMSRSTPACYNNTTHMQYDKITQKNTNINTKESRHSEMGPVRQNPIQRTVRTADVSVLMTQYSTEQFW